MHTLRINSESEQARGPNLWELKEEEEEEEEEEEKNTKNR
jgi:hypothetical protein